MKINTIVLLFLALGIFVPIMAMEFKKSEVKIEVTDEEQKELDRQLYDAVYRNDLNTVIDLVEQGANVNMPTIHDFSPLFTAVSQNNIALVKYLIEQGADVDASFDILKAAIRENNLPMVKYLVDEVSVTHDHYEYAMRMQACEIASFLKPLFPPRKK